MKIAYGISAYKDFKQLNRTVRSLQSSDSEFYVHIDKKVNVENIEPQFSDIPNCHITEERYNIQWGGWNQVKYQLLFLKKMLESKHTPDRIFIITGQDYPLWSNSKIQMYCQKYPDKIWMRGINLTKMTSTSNMKRFLTFPHYFRDIDFHSQRLRHFITGGQRELFLKLFPAIREDYLVIEAQKWDIWQSSGYFSCNREVAKHILDTISKYPQISSYFKHTFVPEEITIPTIIFNSKYKDNAEIFPKPQYEGLSTLASLHEFYYNKAIKIYFGKSDYNKLISSGKMFCRKVETGKSDTLMDMIDSYRNCHEEK